MSDKWRPMEEAPKDGTDITILLSYKAYWDKELETWVLVRPLHVESVREPIGWR